MKLYDEYELIETDHDEEQILDEMYATQADEVEMSYEEEQAFIKSCSEKINVIYTHKIAAQLNKGRRQK